MTVVTTGFTLADAGFQGLDFDDATITMSQDTETLTYTQDIWSSRTATVPSPGSQKLSVSAIVRDKYYFKVTNTVKIDNVQELTLNQAFNFTTGTKLRLNDNAGAFVNSGYIIRQDTVNNKIYLAINNNAWSNDLNTGNLITEQFSEQSTYGIVGPIPADINEITGYTFAMVNNTTPGTFDIDLDDYNLDGTGYNAGGGQNLDSFGKFKPYSDDDYSIRIDEVAGGSPYIVGSVINIVSGNISYNAAYSTAQITGLTGVLKITLVANLTKIMQATAVSNTDEVYVITSTNHYLSAGEMIYVDGNPTENSLDEYDGAFAIESVVSPLEFTYKLTQVATTSPATTAGNVNIFVKSPVLKMYYGHQYIFDMSHSSLLGGNLSFSKDNLFKLEYSFNSIERTGTPGVSGEGVPTPIVKLKVDESIVTNISYYFDPSRTGTDSPIDPNSYLDVTDSPYKGTFQISSTAGQTITRGADVIKFPLLNEPEAAAEVSQTTYSTSSVKAVGSISDVRIVNSGGFYTRLPIVSSITSTRQIERVSIENPGTEYAVGVYNAVPIGGNGEGGLVQITVADGLDSEGVTIPGQIQEVLVTSAGKNYTTALIDIESIPGILGSGLAGSGAVLTVVIPNAGTQASIFTKADKVGKIKKLKNNNFGYDYPHDYTLRPEISFPINAQLTSTSILSSITVTNPGSGYSQAPTVVITGGGGSGATAEASIKNGRLDQIIVKDPGAGYSSTPTVSLKSSFNYVVNLDLGLLQFAFPHGITNGAAITLNVVDTGDGADFPLAAGAVGRLNGTTTYFAIAGAANSLENDQLKIALTAANAELGDALSYVNAGEGRQQVLTESFGGNATANVITSTFLEGELVYQGDSLATATAQGYVSTNQGWQIGPRILKIVDYTGTFAETEKVTGVISKSSGTISDLNIARGVLEIGSITKTTGQFIDDVGKPSEIIQKIQDSYYYQDFSYAIKSAVSISEWKEILIKNVHPASFKVFGELNLSDYGFIPNKATDFQLTKSVELAREAIVPNIQSFALVEPVYSEFNNTEVLFRQKRLTSSENILTSVVQRIDDISSQFDGEKIAFPLTVDGNTVVANANQLMIVLNGIVQNPGSAFEIQGDSIVFSEPPQPPASVKYVNVQISQIAIVSNTFTNQSGIFPSPGNILTGTNSGAKITVTSVVGDTIFGFITEGTFIAAENVTVSATGFSANLDVQSSISNIGLFEYGETVKNLTNDTAKVEQINLERGLENALAELRYTVGPSTTAVEVVPSGSTTDGPVPAGTFATSTNYQLGSEVVTVTNIVDGNDSTTLTVTRGQNGTVAVSHQEEFPIYGTVIAVTSALTLSKTAGTYKSTPGLFDIQLNDVIIGAKSGVVARITQTSAYQDPTTQEFISQVNISEGSSFFGLLMNRITSQTYPNVVIDNISESQVSIVKYTDNTTAFNSEFPANEQINNIIVPYDNLVGGPIQENEIIRNYRLGYGSNSGDFIAGESARSRKLSYVNAKGDGFFATGQVIRTQDTKAEVLGFNQADQVIYLGKVGRTLSTGQDVHIATFSNQAQLDTTVKYYGTASLQLVAATNDYINIPSSSEFAFGTGAFTIDLMVRPAASSLSGTATILDMRASAANEVAGRLYLEAGQVRWNVNNSDLVTSGSTVLSADTWVLISIMKSGTTTKILLNGTEAGTATDNTTYVAKPVRLGSDYAGANSLTGFIDELRISNTNRHQTIPFTPQNGIWQGDANTLVLMHFDGADAQTFTEDWSGAEGFTAGEDFNNDAILNSSRSSSNTPGGFVGRTQRYYDAADLIILNKEYLAQEVVYILKERHPHHTVKGSEVDCEDDVRDVLDAIVSDLRNGTNNKIWDASSYYVDRAVSPIVLKFVSNEVDEVVYTYDKLEELLKYIVNNTLWDTQGDHGLVQKTDKTITESSGLVASTFQPTGASYDAASGYMVLTASAHGMRSERAITATDADYTATTGVLQVTVATTTFSVSTATYAHTTGVMVITIGAHSLTTNDNIRIATGGITFSCNNGGVSNAAYPRAAGANTESGADYAYDRWLPILAVGATTITVNVNGGKGAISHAFAHTYVSSTAGAITAGHGLNIGDRMKFDPNSLVMNCTSDGNTVNQSYPRPDDPANQGWLEVTANTGTTFDINVGTSPTVNYTATAGSYNADTGFLTMNIGQHNLRTGRKYTATNASYTASSGAMKITIGDSIDVHSASYVAKTGLLDLNIGHHNFKKGSLVQIAPNSLFFTCSMDDHQSVHAYPRSTDPVYQDDIEVIDITNDTITVDVGTSPEVSYTPTGATYNTSTGDMVLTIGAHSLAVGTAIKLLDESISFTCSFGSGGTTAYPRPLVDTANVSTASYNAQTGIFSVTTSAAHNLTGPTAKNITDASYNASTGVLQLTSAGHGFAIGDKIRIKDDALTFTCTKDGNATNHTYPRSTDPVSGQWLTIVAKATDTFDLQVGASKLGLNEYTHTWAGGTAANAIEKANDVIKFVDDSMTFTCALDGNATNHTYPRSTDPVSGQWLIVENVASTTFDVQVLDNAPSTNTSAHTFVSATTGAVTIKRDPAHDSSLTITAVAATTITVNVTPITSYSSTTHTFASASQGAVVVGGDYTHKFVSAASGAVVPNHGFYVGDRIMFEEGSLVFTCNMDTHSTRHAYPRESDPFYNKWLPISNVTTNTFDVNVGTTTNTSFTPTGGSYDGTTGKLGITIGSHTLEVGQHIKIATGGISFTCAMDGGTAVKAYPRATDPANDSTLAIIERTDTTITVDVGESPYVYFDVSAATYNPTSGVMVLTIGDHGLTANTSIRLKDNSLTFSCDQGGTVGTGTYPRSSNDYVYQKAINIDSVTDTTITINVNGGQGAITNTNAHTFVSALPGSVIAGGAWAHTYSTAATNAVSVGGNYAHIFKSASPNGIVRSGETIRIAKDGISFKCSQDGYQTIHSYPRTDDPGYNTSLPIYNNGTTSTASNASYNASTGEMVITVNSHGFTTSDQIRIENESLTFTCTKDSNTTIHSYPRENDPFVRRWLRITAVTDNTFTVNVGRAADSTQQYAHTFASATKDGIVKRDDTVTVNVGATPTKSFTPTASTYNPSTGALALTIGTHSLPAPTLHTPTDVAYNPTTGIMTLTISGHNFSNGEKIKIADNGLKLSCPYNGASGTAAQKDYPRSTDPVSGKWIPISNVTTNTFDVKVLDIIPSTNTDTHTFVSAVTNCVSKANSTVKIAEDSLIYKCAEDSNATEHSYPRGDVSRNTAQPGTFYNPVTGVLKLSVPTESHTPSTATYNPTSGEMVLTLDAQSGAFNVSNATYNTSTGDMELTIGTHTLTTNDRIKIKEGSLKFACNFGNDNYQTPKAYPRASGANTTNGADYAFNTFLDISAVTGTTITVNVNGGQGSISNNNQHNFISADAGAVVVGHGLVVGDRIKIADEGLTFSCDQGGTVGNGSYPRSTNDYVYRKWIRIRAVTGNTITVNVNGGQGATTNTNAHTFVSAVANAITSGHGMTNGTPIKLADESLTFACTEGTGSYAYPRSTDPVSKRWLFIQNVTDSSFDVNVLDSLPSTNVTTHTWISAVADGIIEGDPIVGQAVPVEAVTSTTITVNPLDGDVPTNTSAHTFEKLNTYQFQPTAVTYTPTTGVMSLTSTSHKIKENDKIFIKENSLSFKCNMGDDAGLHTYPRETDPVANKWITATNVTANTFDVNVGTTPNVFYTPSDAEYNPTTGIMSLTIGKHDLRPGTSIKLGQESLTFKCANDSYATNHSYPRNTILSHTPTDADYHPDTGIMTLTVNGHNMGDGDWVKIADGAVTFKCTYGAGVHTWTGGTASNAVQVQEAGLGNFDVTNADYNALTGDMVLTVGSHSITTGNTVKIVANSLTFSCDLDANATNHTYPRATDPAYDTALAISAVTGTTITVNVGVSSPGTAYPRASDPVSGKWIKVFNTTTNTFDVQLLDIVPSTNTSIHTFLSAVTNGISQKKDSAFDSPVEIVSTTPSTITIKVIRKTPSTDTSNHIFVSAAANAVISGGAYTHTFITADPDAITRSVVHTGGNYNHVFSSALTDGVITGGNYVHTFVSAATNGIKCAGDAVYLAPGSLTFTCSKDGNDRPTGYPRTTDPSYNQLLEVKDVTTDTFTIDVGAAAGKDQYTHTWVSSSQGAVSKSDYNLKDCSDVFTTVGNLVDILTDTLTNANASTPVDHLGSITKVTPPYKFYGGTVDAYNETPFPVTYHDATNDIIVTDQIDEDTQYRFRDAAYLIRANSGVIVDKAAFDMLTKYPDLAISMPRNANGTSTDGTVRCKQDLLEIVTAVASDLENGGNLQTLKAAKFYIGTNGGLQHIRLQVFQSVYAHKQLGIYLKQACTGDLTYDNTDNIIVGDWGITDNSSAGNCANVQTAIDTLITSINDLIAPTDEDFAIAADRLYFNKDFIAEEVTGLTTAYFTYDLNGINYSGLTYPSNGVTTCQRDLKLILDGIISDLQTGGTESTILAMETYISATLQIEQVDDELAATIYAIDRLKYLGEFGIENQLYSQNESAGLATQYEAVHTNRAEYRDSITPTNIQNPVYAFRDLCDIAINILAPGGKAARSAVKQLKYNQNYYKEELTTLVNSQFGVGSWTYNTFIDEMVNNTVHDILVTDFTKTETAYTIQLTGTFNNYTAGETVISSGGGRATVLEWNDDDEVLYVSSIDGNIFAPTQTLIGADSNAFGTIAANGVSAPYIWYTSPANIKALNTARLITSNIQGQVAGTNLAALPETFTTNWTDSGTNVTVDQLASPDSTTTADKIIPDTSSSIKYIYRNFAISAFETFDSDAVKFDTTNETFDTGAIGAQESQQYSFSVFLKQGEYSRVRVQMGLDTGTAGEQLAFFDLNLADGSIGSMFTPGNGITIDAFGTIPYGNGWYRAFITGTFSFGFGEIRTQLYVRNAAGDEVYTGDGSSGIYAWGMKLFKGVLDPYQSVAGQVFFADTEFNIKTYALDLLQDYMTKALTGSLISPSTNAGFYSYYDNTINTDYKYRSIERLVRYNLNIIREQLEVDTFYTTLTTTSGVSVPAKTYGTRVIPAGIQGGVQNATYVYGLQSDHNAEVETISENSGKVVQVYQRFRIDGDITDGPFTMNEVVAKQGNASVTGVVYGYHFDDNYKYLDVKVTAGPWAVTDNVVGATNSTTAQISLIEDRIHIIDVQGEFTNDIPFKGYTSSATASPTGYIKAEASVTDNTGGTLTVDTASLLGSFEATSVVYPSSSRKFIDVSKYAGLDIAVGDRIASGGYKRFGVSVLSGLNSFTQGNRLYKVVSGIQDTQTYGIITEVDIDNGYIYVAEYQGTFTQGDVVGDYGTNASFPIGYASILTIVTTAGAAAALVQDVRDIALNKRLYLTDIAGTFDDKDYIVGPDAYRSVVIGITDLKGRVKRSFKGFDGTTTTFPLTINTGTSYLPDPAGHLLIFLNGILQPPGASNAYTAFSDKIQFTEAPDLGASFTGFYVGKLRQLDDISFEFDSLRQSFNLKRNDVFYSLTLTEGVQSSTILPENNIIVSLNGVIQEPGVGFEIVGSRIIFSEIPRVGSTFVAFSYVGSEADVDAAEVVPPVEPGDFIDIQGETSDREVAVIESSNSLITFDYLGSVFGKDAQGQANITSGTINTVQVTSGGSGYTTRPTVRLDSISGFDGNVKALVGVAGVEISNPGSGYQNPAVAVETVVDDNWTAPDLSLYGEEEVDPETP